MEETRELVDKISPRLTKVRQERLDFLWNDFLGAVEKVINRLTDEELAATGWITIIYEVKNNDEHVYRSKKAQTDWQLDSNEFLVYEENDICLGTKNMLERTLKDFKKKAEEDACCNTDYFEPPVLYESDSPDGTSLDFSLNSIDIEFRKLEKVKKYKIVLE